ncbi:porin [soil metagenome]
MKRSLLALALFGAFAGAASAQSSVTVYGLVDLGITRQNDGTSAMAGGNGLTGPAADRWDMRQGYASRLGFRGIEDLGGGLRAAFNIEHRFTPDNGVTGVTPGNNNQFWFGRSTVSLQGPFGEVLLGRDYIPAFWVALAADPFNFNTIGQLGTSIGMAGYSAVDTAPGFVATRNNNQVLYKSPVIAGGLTASAAVSLGEGARGQLGRSMGANVEYKAGPIYAGLGIDQTTNNGAGNDPQLVLATASYDFGFIKPILGLGRNRPIVGGNVKLVSFGLNAPIGAVGVVHAVVARLDPSGSNNNLTKGALGYEHNLSKRTSLYADVASSKRQGLTRTTGVDFGVTHRF